MDYGESSEFDSTLNDDDWDEIDVDLVDETPAPVTVVVQFKSGLVKEWTFTLPKTSEMYNGTITRESLLELVASSYSVGEAPYIILLLDSGEHVFLDLGATDYMELR